MSSLFNISSEFSRAFLKNSTTSRTGNRTQTQTVKRLTSTAMKYRMWDHIKTEMLSAWFDTLTGIEGEFNAKAENIGVYIKQLKAEKEAIDAEIKVCASGRRLKEGGTTALKITL